VPGSLQVPANGQPLLMMADGPPTGGYPKIAVVVSADLHLLAQCTPGAGQVRFRETTVEAAQARYRAMMRQLSTVREGDTWRDETDVWLGHDMR
jgi:antagonist of KipI